MVGVKGEVDIQKRLMIISRKVNSEASSKYGGKRNREIGTRNKQGK
jgi:hypothetical protein